MSSCLPYSFLILLFAISPTICLLLMTCVNNRRKDRAQYNPSPTESTSRVSVSTSQRGVPYLSDSPDLLRSTLTATPLPTSTTVTPSQPIVSEYCKPPTGQLIPSAAPVTAIPKSGKESSPTVRLRDSGNSTVDSYHELYRSSEAYPAPGNPLEPISSDPPDRSHTIPVKKEVKRADEIRKGMRADPAKSNYNTLDGMHDKYFSDSFTISNKTRKEKREKKEAVSHKQVTPTKQNSMPRAQQSCSTQISQISKTQQMD